MNIRKTSCSHYFGPVYGSASRPRYDHRNSPKVTSFKYFHFRALSLALLGLCALVNWSQAVSFYVDNAATGLNNGTSWANAWTSFSRIQWANVSPGDTIYISGGATSKTYSESNYVAPFSSILRGQKGGTAGHPITITAGQESGHDGKVIFDGTGKLLYGCVIWGFDYTVFDGGPKTNFILCNMQRQDDVNRMAGAGYFGSGGGHQIFSRCIVSNVCNGAWWISSSGDIEVSSNQFLWIVGDVGVGANTSVTTFDDKRIHHNFIQCIVSDKGPTPALTWGGPDATSFTDGASLWANEMVDRLGAGWTNSWGQHPDVFQSTGGGSNLKIWNNKVHGFYNSVFELDPLSAPAHDVYVWNNLFLYDYPEVRGASHNMAEISTGRATVISNLFFWNNTWVDFAPGGGGFFGFEFDKAQSALPGVTNCGFWNNIFYNCGQQGYWMMDFGSYYNPNFHSNDLSIRFNLINAGSVGSTVINVGVKSPGNYNLANLQGISAAPLFASYATNNPGNDYHLATNSPGIAAGTNLTTFMSQHGLKANDYDGATRPSTGAWTVGAFEFQGVKSQTGALISVAPLSLDFGSVAVGGTADQSVTVQNVGDATLSGAATVAAPFSIVAGGTYNLNPGQSQTVTVRYSPSQTGTDSQQVFFTGSSGAGVSVGGSGGILPAAELTVETPYQAESGTISGPFIVTNGYIVQPVETTLAASARAAYSFNVTDPGDYAVILSVDAPGDANNSIFINIDAEPQDPYMIWDIPQTTGSQRRVAAWRGNGTFDNDQFAPMRFTLAVGQHQLIIRGRESNVKIDQILIHKFPAPVGPITIMR